MNKFCTAVFIIIIVAVSSATHRTSHHKNNGVIIQTSNGLLKGKLMKTFDENVEYAAFLKIPFAKPPVKNLRFRSPEKASEWKGIYDSTKEGDKCVQLSNNTIVGSEDCLFLRVYTPKLPKKHNELLPVMYYIHGGAFIEGSPNFDEYGPDNFMEKGVVLALVQYRLGAFGFLSTEDLSCPGNNGIKDQRLGLKWIKENARAFGGDPDKITIFGHSAGSASVGTLLNSPTTSGDYRAAIQQSACEFAYFSRQLHAREKAFEIGKEFGISTNDSKELIDKLQKIEYKQLFTKSNEVGAKLNREVGTLPYITIIEPNHPDAVITQKPFQQVQRGDYNRVPIMLGFTSLEAFTLMNFVDEIVTNLKTDETVLVPLSLYPKDNATKYALANDIKQYYYTGDDSDFSSIRFTSDNIIVRAVHEKSYIISSFSPTHLYKFSYIGKLGDPQHPNRRGVGHAEELYYLFRQTKEPKTISESDYRIRQQLVTLWTNFAKTLNPTPNTNPILDNITWPLLSDKTEYQSLSIDNKLTIRKRVNETDLIFWREMFSYDTKHIGYY